jgi:hypothetical protein
MTRAYVIAANPEAAGAIHSAAIKSLSTFLAQVGVTKCTAWRWKQRGLLKITNICGRCYVTATDEAEFVRRAQAGEFSKAPVVPRRAVPQ